MGFNKKGKSKQEFFLSIENNNNKIYGKFYNNLYWLKISKIWLNISVKKLT